MRATTKLTPACIECEALWLPADEERWRLVRIDFDEVELAFYCPTCAARELDCTESYD